MAVHTGFRRRLATGLLTAAIAMIPYQAAFALILGGEGNKPIADPGWPRGAAVLVNNPGRVAWWEGPPLGGGQWHAECRGDAKAMNAVLADFIKLDARTKRVILHDGVGHSFWLNPNGEPAKEAAARIDWVFMVWKPDRWQHLRRLPADLNRTGAHDADKGPPAELDVYTGGGLRWSDVTVPKGLEVVDQRLEGHGFTPADGIVLEGKVTNLATGRPVAGRMRLERIEPQAKGGYRYEVAARAVADAQGRWVLKQSPAGWHRVVVEAVGFVPRIAGYARFDDQPRWVSYDCGLSRPRPSRAGSPTTRAGRWPTSRCGSRTSRPKAAAAMNRPTATPAGRMPTADSTRIGSPSAGPRSGSTNAAIAARDWAFQSRCRRRMSR